MKRLIPSMFHRRLVLIGAAYGVAVVALGAQLGRLTLGRGAELRERAEARLRYAEWVPTTRGRILDRKGRVLAHDRACYHVAVEYPVIRGDWALEQAREFAKREHQSEWRKSTAAEREALAARYLPVFERHLDAAWERLARETGVTPQELAEDRQVVVETVEDMAEHLRGRWVAEFRAQLRAAGRDVEPLEPDDRRRMERIRSQETAEQQAVHVVVRAVTDEVAFALLRLADDTVLLDPTGSGDPDRQVEAPLLPGLRVEDGATREYPFESVFVDIDQSTMPLPLRADGRRSVAAVGVLADVLGWMGPVNREVLDRRRELRDSDPGFAARTTGIGLDGELDLGQYLPGDLAGARGVEARYESELRGLRGQAIVRRDTDERFDVPPAAGRDVALTVDALLQARVQAAMSPDLGLARVQAWHGNHAIESGTDLVGAAVVLDVDTGEVLAMVSTPGVTQVERRRAEGRALARDREERARRAAYEEGVRAAPERAHPAYEAMYNPRTDPDALLRYNRAVSVAYAPGSVAKVVVLLEAIRAGVYRLSEHIECTGHLLEHNPNALRCWIFKTYETTHNVTMGHDLSAAEALTASCNIFFYTLGQRLGPEGMIAAYRHWGVGEAYDLGLPAPATGVAQIDEVGEAILAGIGQGPVTWTPMHAADALAAIARGGVRLEPRLVAEDGASEWTEPEVMGLEPAAIQAVIDGLEGAVHDGTHGTGHHITFTVAADGVTLADGTHPATRQVRDPIFNIPGVRVVGKTGTATARLVRVLDEQGRPVLDDEGNLQTQFLDHSWYVALVGPESGPEAGRLKYAIAVMMENAGSGGKVSGPICNQIVAALVEEGYLPRVAGGEAAR
jgi:cell division protein FtsI/penicillin-binding protein 2